MITPDVELGRGYAFVARQQHVVTVGLVMRISGRWICMCVYTIAFPVAWYGLHNFLQGYAYRTDISWWVFAAAGVITLLVAMITVSFKCVQAALANPVKSLRAE